MPLRTNPEALFIDLQLRAGIYPDLQTAPASYTDDLELDEIDLTPAAQDTVRVTGRTIDTLGQSLFAVKRPTGESSQISLKTSTYTPAILALAMGASVAEVAIAATPVADQAITLALNVWVPVYDGPIESVSLDVSGAVAVDKFELDADNGFIRAVHADAVGTGTINYTPSARTYEQYSAGSALDSYWHLTGRARNAASGLTGQLDIWCANLSPSTPLRVPASNEAFVAQFSGDMVVPTVAVRGFTPSTPYRFRDRRA